ncbi:DNA alkylation repair protein [Ruania alba]|uniref:3-methyladenine DNA glycosylase AlkD n=1 Tax=Ruania alba TaxID=648782 RepID=A0A1H5MYV9_9MICO|nr:DNA alkylation repair protein [Ruania alba]SEE94559.1 3-methyladenine DNA glycosylase AlkD [Ruania alba]
MNTDSTVEEVIAALREHATETEREKISRRLRGSSRPLGVRMGTVFDIAKQRTETDLQAVAELLRSPWYEARMVGVSILDFRARKRLTDDQRAELADLYLDHHDTLDTWDFVDRAAPRVLGGWLLTRTDRGVLEILASSPNLAERRSAITATFWLVRNGEIAEALAVAELLAGDPHTEVTASVGVALREVSVQDPAAAIAFLRRRGGDLPRPALRTAVSKLDEAVRTELLGT